jgi:Flp pilus assembly protein TadD/cell division protein FtsN
MNKLLVAPKLAKVGLIGLAYGGIMVMTATEAPRAQTSAETKAAAKQADRASKALTKHDTAKAIAAAEAAVAFAPRAAAYRMLLAQSYLQAGRFESAGQAFADTLELDSGNGKAALNLALTQIAGGDWQAARRTLVVRADVIPASDRGLALALAGDTAGAVALLTEIARSPEASAKVRQNLALSYALGGQWQAARVVAAADMSPADVDARLEQWAAFAQPQAASDQVASLLGVRPTTDAGQPVALALNAPVPVQVAAVAQAAPAASHAEIVTRITSAAVEPVVAATPAMPQVAFGPTKEVVQPITALLIARASGPAKLRLDAGFTRAVGKPVAARPAKTPSFAPASGQWFVQLGAFESAGVAKDAWGRAQRRFAGFGGHAPNGMTFKTGSATFYRLSVGGFSRADAASACRQYRAKGGHCFVRQGAGDQVASWVKPARVQLAMR